MEVFADMHIHIGRSENGKPIKITASRELKFENIMKEAAIRKGLQLIGIIDCASPYVIEDIINLIDKKEVYEQKEGGLIYKNTICIILGAKNITLSTQHARLSGYELIDIVEKYNGILIPAHIFTPHKSYYGHCTDRLEKIFKEKFDKIKAVELRT